MFFRDDSLGSSTELENEENVTVKIVSDVLTGSTIKKLIDRDDRTETEIEELNTKGIKVLPRRNLESYLLDDEILATFCKSIDREDLIDTVLDIKSQALANSVERGNPADDVKSASGEIFVQIRRQLNGHKIGSTQHAFFRDVIAPLIKPDMQIYKELESILFD